MEAAEQFILGSPVFLLMLVPVALAAVIRHLGVRFAAMLRTGVAKTFVYRMDEAAFAAGSC
jgi:hypothetical protein